LAKSLFLIPEETVIDGEVVAAQGLEGLVAKCRVSVYVTGERSGAWQKMRINKGQDFVIGAYNSWWRHL
jgi:ATP-dependent DNA ligase